MTRYLGMPPKKAQADSRPAMTSSSFWLKMGQTKQCPGVGQHHQQRPHRLPAACLLVLDEAQPPEVQFRHLPGPALLHPHRSGATSLPVAPAQPPVQGRIGDPAAPLGQQLLDAPEL